MKSIVIMPFYNEETNSKFYTEEIILTFNKSNYLEFDYLLIDDCSVDNTFQELEKIIDKFDNVNLKKNKKNYGHGKTVVEGYEYAVENNYDVAIQIDGDNAGEPESILKMMEHAYQKDFDLCLATRMKRPDNAIRKIITRILFFNLYILFKVKSNDSNVGIRYMKTSFLEKINLSKVKNLLIPNAYISSFGYYKGYKISNFPVNMRNNVRKDRSGEQWGSGNSIKSVFKLLNGSAKCFFEVNTTFRKLM